MTGITQILTRGGNQEPWSSVLIGMFDSLKPAKSSAQAHRSSRPSQHPAAQSHHDQDPRTINGSIDDQERPIKRTKLTITSRGHAAPATDPALLTAAHDTTTPRPPTKLTRPEPHGDLVQTTNGVRTNLLISEDEIPGGSSGVTTPQGSSSGQQRAQQRDQKSQEKRTLRSHDDSGRLKSELSVYFPNYEEIINDIPQEQEFLTIDTVLRLKDAPTDIKVANPPKPSKLSKVHSSGPKDHRQRTITSFLQPSPSRKFNGAQVVDFSSIEKSVPHHPQDPLIDAVYFKPHRRAERKEKQLRNIEKERAMHEKVQLERLLDALQGHDWLKILGITGVTDSEAKRYEAKRDYFISEVQSLVQKFKLWKEEEKRLKLGKDVANLPREEEEDEVEVAEEESEREPSSSEIDASAAHQLLMEASGSIKGKARQRMPHPDPIIYRPPSPERPFTSFYDKPHLRAAALGTQRHGRNLTAFGVPLPEVDEHEFALPADYVTPDALKESARRRRRMKRESLVDGAKK